MLGPTTSNDNQFTPISPLPLSSEYVIMQPQLQELSAGSSSGIILQQPSIINQNNERNMSTIIPSMYPSSEFQSIQANQNASLPFPGNVSPLVLLSTTSALPAFYTHATYYQASFGLKS